MNQELDWFEVRTWTWRVPGMKKKSQKTLILAFEVIVLPLKHTFEIGIFFAFKLIVDGGIDAGSGSIHL